MFQVGLISSCSNLLVGGFRIVSVVRMVVPGDMAFRISHAILWMYVYVIWLKLFISFWLQLTCNCRI